MLTPRALFEQRLPLPEGLVCNFPLSSHWKSLNDNITACTHSQQESLSSADNLGTREERLEEIQSCVSVSILESGKQPLRCSPCNARCWFPDKKLQSLSSLTDIDKAGTQRRQHLKALNTHVLTLIKSKKVSLGTGDNQLLENEMLVKVLYWLLRRALSHVKGEF